MAQAFALSLLALRFFPAFPGHVAIDSQQPSLLRGSEDRQQDRVDLDVPVARYLPDVPVENRWEPESPLRVRHLLDHTGSLDDARMWQVFSLRANSDAPLLDGLTHPGGPLRLRYRPGERFSYSNTEYLLLGILIETVTGTRYERWLDAELLAPLGMTRSRFAFVTQTGPGADPTLALGHFDPRSTSANQR